MTKIVWDAVGERLFETGVDRAVLYTSSGAVPWNGVISVDVKHEGFSKTPVYFDDRKVNEVVYQGDFSATLNAYTYPDEFLPFDGFAEIATGMYIDNQIPDDTFCLSYRTLIGNDEDGIDHGYKIHILYDLTAAPADLSQKTVESNVEPIEFSWELSSIPGEIPWYRPSAHLVLDSRTLPPDVLAEAEAILYGTEEDEAYLPELFDLFSMLGLKIRDNEDGTWTAIGPDSIIDVLDGLSFSIDSSTVTEIDAYTYSVS